MKIHEKKLIKINENPIDFSQKTLAIFTSQIEKLQVINIIV